MDPSRQLLEAIAITAELTGTQLSAGAACVFAADLSAYPEHQVLGALVRCRREVKGRLSLADVISRLDDGRPGPEEAWAMIPKDEAGSVVWTDEMAQAFGVASPLMEEPIQARMAFLEAYRDRVRIARDQGSPVRWTPSLGHDPAGREVALADAVHHGRLSAAHAQALLPHSADPGVRAHLESMVATLAIAKAA
ncbi:MAG: hypothetical protein IPP91_11190 [Betaproteobacteria bacterium]|nr:hypothetical protein [Betaproteobacteria bacterium]